ncbi:Extracellular metalloproteinase NpI [Leucoagaricus sp. SymC.cos]|nr:Extracellular metalloproteinase NpI [Leucoagaricus sp. SymC.cos]
MTLSSRLTAIVVLSALYCGVSAAPAPLGFRPSTHQTRIVGRGLQLHTYHPPSTFETFGTGIDHPLSKRDNPDIQESAIAFLQSYLGVSSDTISFKSGYSAETAKHAYVKQTLNGIPIANAVANVAFNNENKVVAFGSSFVEPKATSSATPSITLEKATAIAEDALDGTHNGQPASLQYIAKDDGSLVLTHSMQIQNEAKGTWYDAFVDAHSGELVHVTDFVAKASYLVLPIQKQTLTQGFEMLVDPYDSFSSPLGWHSDGTTNYTTTTGNNAMAYKDTTQSSLTGASSPVLNFVYKQDPTQQPTVQVNVDAARTNAFYITNTVHDIMYRYGFTEVGSIDLLAFPVSDFRKSAYNFQTNNFGKGGKGNDPVQVSVQSSAGLDNADFATPADGQMPLMRMFLWDYVQPMRDGALENDIVVHENTHGMTNRMTGGGTGACLQTTESGGLGEGWSDAVAEWTEHNSSAVPDYVMGQYVSNWAPGLRSRSYSTSMTVNPLTYASLKGRTELHGVGEIWANLLHNVYAALVGKYGWSATSRTDPTGSEGNVVFLHLLIDALALQPCNPTFLNARDAWIQADTNRYKGMNKCLLWNVFASRGMGVNATSSYVDDHTVPGNC